MKTLPTQLEEDNFIKGIVDDARQWLVQIAYWYGWTRGAAAMKKEQAAGEVFYLSGYELRSSELEYRWYRSQARIYLTICEKDALHLADNRTLSGIIFGGKPVNDHLVFGRNDLEYFPPESMVRCVEAIEQTIRQFFPKIHPRNSYRICSMPAHLRVASLSRVYSDPVFRACSQVGERWLCDDCVERYDLEPQRIAILPGLNEKQQAEFARFKPALRLSILKRDGFTCATCHRSPLKGHDVHLIVFHRVPLTEGGKAVAENLTTICRECRKKIEKR